LHQPQGSKEEGNEIAGKTLDSTIANNIQLCSLAEVRPKKIEKCYKDFRMSATPGKGYACKLSSQNFKRVLCLWHFTSIE
jgi:hypothetical protein